MRYIFARSGTSVTATIPEADAQKNKIPRQDWRPDFLAASQALQLIAYLLTLTPWNKKGETTTITTTVKEILKVLYTGAPPPTEREKRTAITRIKDGLTTLHYIDFTRKKVTAHCGEWRENSRGVITIQLPADFTRLLTKTHQSYFFPQLLTLTGQGDFIYRLYNIMQWRAPSGTHALSIKTIFKWLAIPLTDGRVMWKQRARLESALDELTRRGVLTAWKYTKPRSTETIPRELTKPQEWTSLVLKWKTIKGGENNDRNRNSEPST